MFLLFKKAICDLKRIHYLNGKYILHVKFYLKKPTNSSLGDSCDIGFSTYASSFQNKKTSSRKTIGDILSSEEY